MDLTGIYRIFHPKIKEYTVFSLPHGSVSKINHVMGHKTSLIYLRKMKIIPCILLDYHVLRLFFNKKITTTK